MTIRTVYHASDGTQHTTRAAAQRYERALVFLAWCSDTWPGERFALPTVLKTQYALAIAERWYLHDRQSPRKRGKPRFTGRTCLICGGQMEEIASCEVCVTCAPEQATRLRRAETGEAPDAATS